MTGMEKLVQVATCLKKKNGQVRKTVQQKHGQIEAEELADRRGGRRGGGWVLFAAAVQFNWPDVKVLFSPEGFSSARISFRISRSN